jgi:hypothetical protein
MKTITKEQLFDIFKTVNGTTFIGIDTLTNVTLTGGKGNEFQGRIQKLNEGSNVMVFQNKNSNGYENMVQKRLQQEHKDVIFEVAPRKWGERIPNSPFIKHTPKGSLVEKLYLEVIFLRSGRTSYLLDGKPISKESIVGLPEDREESGQGGLESRIILRTYALDSICRVSINKEVYNVR